VALPHAAGQVEQLAQRHAERRLILAGRPDVAGQREDAESLGLLGAERGELGGAAFHDERDAGDRLDVVDDRRARVQAGDRRERRLQPRLPAPSLQRVQQRGFLAALVRACPRVHHHLQPEA
jgi:hypothetical protein